jgi:hypothetical protein
VNMFKNAVLALTFISAVPAISFAQELTVPVSPGIYLTPLLSNDPSGEYVARVSQASGIFTFEQCRKIADEVGPCKIVMTMEQSGLDQFEQRIRSGAKLNLSDMAGGSIIVGAGATFGMLVLGIPIFNMTKVSSHLFVGAGVGAAVVLGYLAYIGEHNTRAGMAKLQVAFKQFLTNRVPDGQSLIVEAPYIFWDFIDDMYEVAVLQQAKQL